MKRIILVSCVKTKTSGQVAAKDLYTSAWFKYARQIAERSGDPWFLLSSKYKLMHPDKCIEDYDVTLNNMPVKKRREWADQVITMMKTVLPDADQAVIFASVKYREFLLDYLDSRYEVKIPMERKRNGKQIQWLKKEAETLDWLNSN